MTLSRRFLISLALLAGLAAPAAAQTSPFEPYVPPGPADSLASLRAMMALVPAMMVSPQFERAELTFSDVAAARSLDLGQGGRLPAALRPLARALASGPLAETLAMDWRPVVGFAPVDIAQVVQIQAPPLTAQVMVLDPGAAAGVPGALAAQGYAAVTQFGVSALAIGDEGRIDLARRSYEDPFVGRLGRSARVQVEGDVIRHGSTWPLLAALVQADRAPATGDPTVVALLAQLEGVGGGTFLRAVLYPDVSGLTASDPLMVVTGRASPAAGPVWGALLLADFADGPMVTTAMVLTLRWPDDASLLPLIDTIARRWESEPGARGRTMAEVTGTTPELSAEALGGGRAVLRLVLRGASVEGSGGLIQNRGFEQLMGSVMMRDTAYLP